jgi:hypothetical protein
MPAPFFVAHYESGMTRRDLLTTLNQVSKPKSLAARAIFYPC